MTWLYNTSSVATSDFRKALSSMEIVIKIEPHYFLVSKTDCLEHFVTCIPLGSSTFLIGAGDRHFLGVALTQLWRHAPTPDTYLTPGPS